MVLKSGKLLKNGEYRIERVLGKGGFGITYLAYQISLSRRVAIKEFFMSDFCNRDADTSHVSVPSVGSKDVVEKSKRKFIKEARNIASLNNPHIIRIYDIFEDNGTAYYVMEYHEAGSLEDLLKDCGKLPERQSLFYIRQIAEALQYIHKRSMLHLDLKPGNIMLDDDGHAVLIDFGVSKRFDNGNGSEKQTTTTTLPYTPGYAPLEQMDQGGSGLKPSADIYALGATLYKLLSGETPPTATSRASGEALPPLPSFVSPQVRNAIKAAMQLNKLNRPQSVSDFLVLLEGKKKKKLSSWIFVLLALVLSVGIGAGLYMHFSSEGNGGVDDDDNDMSSADEIYDKGLSSYNSGKYFEAFNLFQEAANSGHVDAQDRLGDCYLLGYGVDEDNNKAVKWYRKAAEQGHAPAQWSMGQCYFYGWGVDEDNYEAVKWYRKSAEQGYADAQYNLGLCYADGYGVDEDDYEAVEWYRKAAEQENADAQHMLGACYCLGEGVDEDIYEAVKWYRKAAEQEYARAQYMLGVCYKNGDGVDEDDYEAVKWFRKAAEQGHASAQCELGYCYYMGEGVDEDNNEAVKWFRYAAEQGEAKAQCYLGTCYEYGYGVDEDDSKAVEWYRKSADQGHEGAKQRLKELGVKV